MWSVVLCFSTIQHRQCLEEDKRRKRERGRCTTELANTTMVSQSPCNNRETSSASQSVLGTPQTPHSLMRNPSHLPHVVSDGLPLIRENSAYKDLFNAAQNMTPRHNQTIQVLFITVDRRLSEREYPV